MTKPENTRGHEDKDEEVEITTSVRTGVDYSGRGTTLAVETVERGDRRVDYRIGHLGRTFAETYDLYYQGELLHQGELETMLDRPVGDFIGGQYREPLSSSTISEDEVLVEIDVWGAGTDATEWAEGYIEHAIYPEEVIGELWEVMKEGYDSGELRRGGSQ